MDITIRKLTPELAQDYVRFFDETPHDDLVDEHKCYCVCWSRNDCSGDYESTHLSSRERRRQHALECVRDGSVQGYLAYCGGKAVGWCNANTKADCLKCYSWRQYMSHVPLEDAGAAAKVKSIFCFTIAPQWKRRGIATLLMQRVCDDAARDGFAFVEAYPNKEFRETDCSGPYEMYRKHGFTACGPVVRKRLQHPNQGGSFQ